MLYLIIKFWNYGDSGKMEKIKQIFASACGFFITIGIIIGIVAVIAIIGGSIMHLFGFEYRSIGQLILFFVIVAVVGFPLELFAKAFPEAMLSLGRLSLQDARTCLFVGTCFLPSFPWPLWTILWIAFPQRLFRSWWSV